MKRTVLAVIVVGLFGLVAASFVAHAQPKSAAQKWEAAIIKWDGNDRVQVMTPAKSEVVRVYQAGGQKVADIPEEEYCLTWAANKLAQEGWELVNLNSRRILMQRAVSR